MKELDPTDRQAKAAALQARELLTARILGAPGASEAFNRVAHEQTSPTDFAYLLAAVTTLTAIALQAAGIEPADLYRAMDDQGITI